jgi:hypothetical protein
MKADTRDGGRRFAAQEEGEVGTYHAGLKQPLEQGAKERLVMRRGKMPVMPDGGPDDENGLPDPLLLGTPRSGRLGKEGRPTHFTGAREDHVPAWKYPLKAQISAIKDELRSLLNDIAEWSRRACDEERSEDVSGAVWVLGWLWQRWRRTTSHLKWLRSEIPVNPDTGQDMADY